MKTAADVIIALEGTTKRNEKEKIVLDAWNKGIFTFFEGTQMAYDALRTYSVKKVPLIEDADEDPNFVSTVDWNRFKKVAGELERRELTGNAARDTLRAMANECDIKDWNYFYRRVLLKDFKCNTSDSTVNKVLEKLVKAGDNRAKDYIVPVFSCQLAKNGDDHPKKLKGPKLLDPKLDGARLLTVVDIDKKTVTQYTRNGLTNTNFPQICTMMEKLIPVLTESMVFDGEIVSQSFQEMMKQLNRKSNIDTSGAKLALFDCLPWKDFQSGEYNLSQTKRHEALVQFEPLLAANTNGAVYVIPKLAVNLDTEDGQKTFREFNNEMVAAGFEGIMVKDPEATYVTDRTDAWLKLKPFITVDLEVVGFEQGKPEGENADGLGGMICEGVDQGKKIKVVVGNGYSDELRAEIWANRSKVKGRIVEVKGDCLSKSDDNDSWSVRFPVFMQFRGFKPGEKI